MGARGAKNLSKLTAQHKWIILLVAFVLVNTAVWLYGLSPALKKVDAAKDELKQGQQLLERLQKQLDNLNAIDTEALEEQGALMAPQVPEEGLLREYIYYFVDLAAEYELSLPSLTVSTPTAIEPYFSVALSTSTSGSYQQLKAFLIALEESERLTLVRNFNFSGSDDTLSCALNITIFAGEFEPLTPVEAPGRDNPFVDK